MNRFFSYKRVFKAAFYQTSCAILLMALLFVPVFPKAEAETENFFTVYVNGQEVGHVGSIETARTLMGEARRQLAGTAGDMYYAKAELTWEGKKVWFGRLDDKKSVMQQMVSVLEKAYVNTLEPAYTMKINDYIVSLSGSDEVKEVLNTVLRPYDKEEEFAVSLLMDPDRELNVLTARVERQKETAKEPEVPSNSAGAELFFADIYEQIQPAAAKNAFANLEYGLLDLDFADPVEVLECWLPEEAVTSLDDALAQITVDKEKEQVYEVKDGDTLSGIAQEHDLTLEALLEINAALEGEEALLREGDEIRITVPEPILSVYQTKQVYTEGSYDAEVVYLENDSWYTTRREVKKQPSAGLRRAALLVTSYNDSVIKEEVMKEEILLEAVAKIVEQGTKAAPTFIKPVSGGILTSNYGGREAPIKGASSNHKGTDWAVPVGTAVMASSGGTVTRAGWGSGYGYVVYIQHENGRETRYGHLSKILVEVGQQVEQGEKIALSGNTGRSSGPHIHFELRIDGEAVNVLTHLQ